MGEGLHLLEVVGGEDDGPAPGGRPPPPLGRGGGKGVWIDGSIGSFDESHGDAGPLSPPSPGGQLVAASLAARGGGGIIPYGQLGDCRGIRYSRGNKVTGGLDPPWTRDKGGG